MSIPDYITVPELAAKLQLRPSTIRQYIADGEIPAVRFGGHYRIRAEDAETWLAEHAVPGTKNAKPVTLPRAGDQTYALRKVAG